MYGLLKFELSSWPEAAEYLKKSQVVYQNISIALPEEEQRIYKAKVEELTPSLRYCAYNMGGNASVDEFLSIRNQGLLKNMDKLITQAKSQTLETVEWQGRKITIRTEKARLFVMSVHDLKETLDKSRDNQSKIEIIENFLIDCKDAINAVKDEIKQDPKLRTFNEDGNLTNIQYLVMYLTNMRLKLTLERNLYLIAQAKANFETNEKQQDGKKYRAEDISRLYEIVLQNVTEMQQLQCTNTNVIDREETDFLQIAFKSFRCFYIALTLIKLKRWKEALAMFDRSTQYVSKVMNSRYVQQYNLENELIGLKRNIEESVFSARANSVLEGDISYESNSIGKNTKSLRPLAERLNQYIEDQSFTRNSNIYKLTPEMKATSCKPLFFDLAYNFVEFPSLENNIQADDKKGITGLVKGLLGWGGSVK